MESWQLQWILLNNVVAFINPHKHKIHCEWGTTYTAYNTTETLNISPYFEPLAMASAEFCQQYEMKQGG